MINLFIDWNPIYGNDYIQAMGDQNALFERKPDEQSPFAKL